MAAMIGSATQTKTMPRMVFTASPVIVCESREAGGQPTAAKISPAALSLPSSSRPRRGSRSARPRPGQPEVVAPVHVAGDDGAICACEVAADQGDVVHTCGRSEVGRAGDDGEVALIVPVTCMSPSMTKTLSRTVPSIVALPSMTMTEPMVRRSRRRRHRRCASAGRGLVVARRCKSPPRHRCQGESENQCNQPLHGRLSPSTVEHSGR